MENEEFEFFKDQVNLLVREVAELKETVRILKQNHSYDIGRVFEEIDEINKNKNTDVKDCEGTN